MLEIRNVSKDINKHSILSDINLVLPSKGLVVIKGENGSGKTTLLNAISLMDKNYSGEILFNGTNIKKLSDIKISAFRNRCISYCMQKNNIITYLDLDKNLELDEYLSGSKILRKNDKSYTSLSQGQQQMVVLNHILKKGKAIYLLDEITACLDSKNTKYVVDKIMELSKEALVIIVSHEIELSKSADVVVKLKKGKAIPDYKNDKAKVEEGLSLLKNKCKLTFNLFFSSIKKHLVLHSIVTFVLSLISILLISGMSGFTVSNSSIIKDSFKNVDYVSVFVENADSLLKKYANNLYEVEKCNLLVGTSNEEAHYKLIDVVKDSIFNGKKHAYVNDRYYENLIKKGEGNSTLSIAEYDYDLVIDNENCTMNVVYIGKDANRIDIRNDKDTAVLYGCGWKTNYHDFGYYRERKFSFFTDEYMERKNISYIKNESMEDDVFYVKDEYMISDDRVYKFDEYYKKDQDKSAFNLNKAFPDGVKVEYFQFKNEKGFGLDVIPVYVTKNTLDKIMSTERNYGGTKSLIFDIRNDNEQKIRYLCDNNCRFSYYDMSEGRNKTRKDLDSIIGYYSSNINRKSDIDIIFWPVTMSIGLIICYFGLELILVSFTNYENKNNNYLLKKEGFNKFKILAINFLPFLVEILITIIIGYALSPMAGSYVNYYGFVPGMTFAEFIVFLMVILFSLGLNYYYLERRK